MMFGADSPALRLLANKLDEIANRLTSISGQVGTRVETMPWTGNDATQFKNTWTNASAPSMNDAARNLRDAAAAIRGDADRQDQASA